MTERRYLSDEMEAKAGLGRWHPRFQTVAFNRSATPMVAIWDAHIWGYPGGELVVQNDGNVVVYQGGFPRWDTHTSRATNTESYGNGDCWRLSTPHTCRTNWSSSRPYIRLRAVDQFSVTQPQWRSEAEQAVAAWNNAGPIRYSWTPASYDSLVYMNDRYTGYILPDGTALPSTAGGATFNYRLDGTFTFDTSTPINAYNSKIFFNRNVLNSCGVAGLTREVVAHESGHAMMLAHNYVDQSSLLFIVGATCGGPYRTGPNGNDIGVDPYCSDGGFGVRCVYGFW